jgi:hypothetical protein
VEVEDALRAPAGEAGDAHRSEAAAAKGQVVHPWEHGFLVALEGARGAPVSAVDLSGPLKRLLEVAAERMSGFDLSDTQDYYRRIVGHALEQARGLGDVRAREERVDRTLEWLWLSDGWHDVLARPGWTYHPPWARFPAGVPAGPAPGPAPALGDVAGSFAGWVEDVASQAARSLSPLSLPSRSVPGLVDLSGVDRVTGDVLSALFERGGSPGGGGGHCACAGCACACACAGGGR